MENLITIDAVRKNESQLRRRIFTELQLTILKKKLQKKPLNINEKTYYYRYIKPKLRAMISFFNIDEVNIKGKDCMIEKRIPKALKILNQIRKKHKSKKIIISGSFLFNTHYNDIDIFIFTRYNKEDYKKGKIHVNFIPESSINSLFFSSLSQISISNFAYAPKKEFDINIDGILHTYELLINHILNKEEHQKELRDFLLQIEYLSKNVVLDPKQLYNLKKKASDIKLISNALINALIFSYDKKNLKTHLNQYIGDYYGLLRKYKQSKNLGVYIDTYKEAIELAA